MKPTLIAPCGVNCSLCLAYQRAKNTCPGCRIDKESKSPSRQQCILKNCTFRKTNDKFCSPRCQRYPCKRLKSMDKRYRTKYGTSMIENLEFIRKHGIRNFITHEKTKWTCPTCGHLLCMHRPCCLHCQQKRSSAMNFK